ncbi:hypothetical protein RT717_26630 [Imperialibacter roseus]|uniref:Uncharacterized protein n=1 Tax=Imperialibacter roseus TaxID=1324217 RepID=A0ABZ0IQD5_9BACT|nr:hypothetical protein [Imperialibacter roseus]WOK06654.1 hypothetical protein RT717_26630 [Imperialibacter roseus]
MELTEETAKKLVKALEGFEQSVNKFADTMENGVEIPIGRSSDLISRFTNELKRFNDIKTEEKQG